MGFLLRACAATWMDHGLQIKVVSIIVQFSMYVELTVPMPDLFNLALSFLGVGGCAGKEEGQGLVQLGRRRWRLVPGCGVQAGGGFPAALGSRVIR